jgi:hypothetical protein
MRFSSAILPPWARKTPQVSEVLPLLYLHGLSSGDFVPALGQFPRRRARMWLDARWRRPTMARRREWGSSLCSFPGRIVVDQVITGNPEGRGGCAVPLLSLLLSATFGSGARSRSLGPISLFSGSGLAGRPRKSR